MMYNAVIRDFSFCNTSDIAPCSPTNSARILGKVLLSDLSRVPSSWRIQYRGKLVDSSTNLGTLMANPQEPLQIFKNKNYKPFTVFVKTLTEAIFEITSDPQDTVEELKYKICSSEGTPVDQQRLLYMGRPMEDVQTLLHYGVQHESMVHLLYGLRGGSRPPKDMSCVNLEASQISGRATAIARYPWSGYTIGLNLYGVCPKVNCISNSTTGCSRKIVLHAKYGIVRLIGEKNKFACPACKSKIQKVNGIQRSMESSAEAVLGVALEKVGMFRPNNFLVSFGRSLFRFKKSGYDQPVKSVLIESLGFDDEYKMFDETEGISEYDFIEITTVGRDASPYYCVLCDFPCRGPKTDSPFSEVILGCGHAFHRKCAPVKQDDCGICMSQFAPDITDISDFHIKEQNELNSKIASYHAGNKQCSIGTGVEEDECDVAASVLLSREYEFRMFQLLEMKLKGKTNVSEATDLRNRTEEPNVRRPCCRIVNYANI